MCPNQGAHKLCIQKHIAINAVLDHDFPYLLRPPPIALCAARLHKGAKSDNISDAPPPRLTGELEAVIKAALGGEQADDLIEILSDSDAVLAQVPEHFDGGVDAVAFGLRDEGGVLAAPDMLRIPGDIEADRLVSCVVDMEVADGGDGVQVLAARAQTATGQGVASADRAGGDSGTQEGGLGDEGGGRHGGEVGCSQTGGAEASGGGVKKRGEAEGKGFELPGMVV